MTPKTNITHSEEEYIEAFQLIADEMEAERLAEGEALAKLAETDKPKKIPFGIIFRGQEDYTFQEVSQFIEATDNIDEHRRAGYIEFLNQFLDGKIKPSTLVDATSLLTFYHDLDNRADIDYREGHWDDCPDVFAGGKFFDGRAKKLRSHLIKHNLISEGEE